MSSAVSGGAVQYKDYVAGWLDSSIHDFVARKWGGSKRSAYALITCLDSDPNPAALLRRDPKLRAQLGNAKTVKNAVLIPSRLFERPDIRDALFGGFDEIWFFPSERVKPKPRAGSIVGPNRIEQSKLDLLGPWMAANGCSIGLGDGNGLNLILKARGFAREVVAKSLEQPAPLSEPHASWVQDEEKEQDPPHIGGRVSRSVRLD